MTQRSNRGDTATWTGFLIVAFAALGLIGAFGTYAAQLPFDRAVARSAALDALLEASQSANPAQAEEALRPRLGDSADRVLSGAGPIAARIASERSRMLADLHTEAQTYGFRLRAYIAVFTAMAALFGAMVMSFGRN